MLRQDPRTPSRRRWACSTQDLAAYLLNGDLFMKPTRRIRARPTRISAAPSRPSPATSSWRWRRSAHRQSRARRKVTHVEHWSLHKGIRLAELTDAELDRVIGPLVP